MPAGPHPTPDDFNGVRDRIVSLFIQKKRPKVIADLLGMEPKRVEKIINQEFNTRLGDRQQMIIHAAMELDWLMRPLMEKYQRDSEEGRPSVHDYRALLEGNKERRRLLGLDAAAKVDVSITDERSEEEILVELAQHGIDVKMLKPPEEIEDAEVEEKGEVANSQDGS